MQKHIKITIIIFFLKYERFSKKFLHFLKNFRYIIESHYSYLKEKKMKKIKKHGTSANVDEKFFYEICLAAEKYNLTRNEIIKDIIKLTIKAIQSGRISGKLIEYQNHSPNDWETIYYTLDENEIELFSASRQKYKISISKLAFIGFILFWKQLIQMYSKNITKLLKDGFFINYDEYRKKMAYLVPYFKKRLCIHMKE